MRWATPSSLILALLLGITCYTNKVDTSSPYHLSEYFSEGFGDKRVVIGKIWKEPEVRYSTDPESGDMEKKDVRLRIRPFKIQLVPPDGPFYDVTRGDIWVTLRRAASWRDYEKLSSSDALGYTVKLRTPLFEPVPAANPGTFDYRQYLFNNGIYAGATLAYPNKLEPPIELLRETKGMIWVETALLIKNKMLAVVKKTIPYPESAFLGGVTLGLRHGLMKLYYKGHPLNVGDAFRWSGTFHVLAVSGLHVTVIAGLLFGISLIFLKSRKQAAALTLFFMVFFALMIFTALTGARPSTMRAFIMASLTLLLWATGIGLRASVLLSIPIAATVILLLNPLVLTEASFTLSFGAVLSLGLITAPTMKYIRRLKGLPSVALLIVAILFPLASYFRQEAFKDLSSTGGFLIFAFLLFLVAYIIQKRYQFGRFRKVESIITYRQEKGGFQNIEELAQAPGIKRRSFLNLKEKVAGANLDINTITPYALGNLMRPGPLFRFGLGDGSSFVLARWFFAFLCAQVAINLGMMLPLSLYYFKHVPYAGPYANFLAIPLITTIIPLGIMAGILGMIIPVLGQYVALLINATNWLLIKFFFWISYTATEVFRYPFEKTPTVYQLVGYFCLLLVYVYFDDIYKKLTCPELKNIRTEIEEKENRPEFSRELEGLKKKKKVLIRGRIHTGIILGFVLLFLGMGSLSIRKKPLLRVLYLSVGYGDSILIETPRGENILIDGGYRSPTWDQGTQTIAPVLVKEGIRNIDTVLLTNLNLEHIGGLIAILKDFEVGQFIDSLGPEEVSPDMSYNEFITLLNDNQFLANSDSAYAHETYETYLELLRVLETRGVVHKKGTYGTIIAKESFRGKDLELYILNPAEPKIDYASSNIAANSIVARLTYGKSSFLFTSDLSSEGEARLVASGNVLKSDILQIPAHGSASSSTPAFLKAVNPQVAVLCYGNAKRSGLRGGRRLKAAAERTFARYQGLVKKCYTTDRFSMTRDMAVIVITDGEKYKIETMRGRSRHEKPFVMRGD
jgi:ComEC/Rec2-related protein